MKLIPHRHLATPLIALLSAGTLSGCGGTAAGQSPSTAQTGEECTVATAVRAVALILPVHQGAPSGGVPQQWRCLVRTAIDRGLPISVITAEGTPRVAVKFHATPDNVNPAAHEDDVQNAEADLLSRIGQLKASSAGNDSWAALVIAADQLASQGGAGEQGLLLSRDNMLSDRGLLRMTDKGMTSALPADVSSHVKQHAGCGRLNGLKINAFGIAEAVTPQPHLSTRQQQAIAGNYIAALKACGADAVSLALPATGNGPTTRYTTGTVAPDRDPTLSVNTGKAGAGGAPAPITLLQDTLSYVPDQAVFADPAQAATVLGAIAKELVQDPNLRVTVRGRTSNGDTAWRSHKELGRARATLCAQTLYEAGVNPRQVVVVGAGYLAQPPVTSPATAALNRATDFTFKRS